MLDIPLEVLLTISTYMDHHDLKAFALFSFSSSAAWNNMCFPYA
jgi:hypothetical protein